MTSPKSVSFIIRGLHRVFLLHESGTCFLRFFASELERRGQGSFSFKMKAFTVSALFGIIFFVQITLSYGRENIDRSSHEGEMDATVQSIHEDAKEEETDPEPSEHKNKNVRDAKEEEKNVLDENDRKREKDIFLRKRSHPQVCPPGWLSPWDFTDNSNCGGCGCGNCGCGGGFGGGISGNDELDDCGRGDYGFGEGCGCGGCGCKFDGVFMRHNGFGRRMPRVFNDGRIQHVWLSKCVGLRLF